MPGDARALLALPPPPYPQPEQLADVIRAANVPPMWRERAEWQRTHALPAGVPLGAGLIIPNAWEPGAHLPHVITALLAGNRVLLPDAAELAPLMHAAQAHQLAVHGVTAAAVPALLHDPQVQFVTWWGESHTGLTRVAELAELAPGQLAPTRVWSQLDANGVALITASANVPHAIAELAPFIFGPAATGQFGIERVVAESSVYDAVVHELTNAAQAFAPLPVPDAARAAQFYQLAQYEGTVTIGGEVQNGAAEPTVVSEVPQSASIACEVLRAPLVAVQHGSDVLGLAAGGLYGAVAAVFSTDEALPREVARRHIAHTVFFNEMRFPRPHEPLPVAKLSGVQQFPDGPELIRNYEHEIALLPKQQ